MVVGVIPVRRGCHKLHTASPRGLHVVPAGSNAATTGRSWALRQLWEEYLSKGKTRPRGGEGDG